MTRQGNLRKLKERIERPPKRGGSNRAALRRTFVKLATAFVMIMGLSMVLTCVSQAASASPAFGTRLVAANQWLSGQGVDVFWNNYASSGPSSGYGTEWQCVELAQRLYKQRGWYGQSIFPNTGAAYQIYDNAPSMGFVRHVNGDGIPAPGDMIIHGPTSTNSAGHVDIVDYVANGVINVDEQNASVTGRASYTLSGSTLINRSGFGVIRGYVHAPANHLTSPPPPAPTEKTVGEARRADGSMDIFVKGTDGAVWHEWLDRNGGLIKGPESFGGQVQGAVNGSWTSDGNDLDMFGVGTDNLVYRDRYDSPSNTFTGWTVQAPGNFRAGSGTVGVARRADGSMDIFVKGTDGAVWHEWLDRNGGLIKGPESFGGQVQGAVNGSWTSDGNDLDMFGVGTDNLVYRDRYDSPSNTFTGWTVQAPGNFRAG